MKRLILLLVLCNTLCAQAQQFVCVNAVHNLSTDSLIRYVTELTGRDSVVVNGQRTRIKSRYMFHPDNDLAASYLEEKCSGYGFIIQDIPYSSTGRNIVMYKPGTVTPKTAYILCAHYDCVGTVNDDFEGADDNASGVAALLEAARLLQTDSFPFTLVLAFWDEEEAGLLGSKAFAPDGPLGYWDVKGVINLDMIGYENNGDSLAQVHTQQVNQSVLLAQKLVDLNQKFGINLNLQVKNPGDPASDHQSFWVTGATAVGLTEDYDIDFNPHWHKATDKVEFIDTAYFTKVAQLAIGSICEIVSTGSVVGLPSQSLLLDEVEVFPNPTVENVQIVMPATIETAECIIRNQLGAKVHSQTLTATSTSTIIELPYPSGIYFVELRFKGGSRILKLVLFNRQ